MRVIRILRICLRIKWHGIENRMVVDLDGRGYAFGIVDNFLCVSFVHHNFCLADIIDF